MQAKEFKYSLEAGKGEEMNLPVESPEEQSPSYALILVVRTFYISELQNYNRF